ncbi:AfsR/SARP family transcriptional regulator [Saccharopolyspora rhizosphaerae]|nr:AfsR/SARP family transcriptional regulator [Saccharopolyspora rhizosphaerae]
MRFEVLGPVRMCDGGVAEPSTGSMRRTLLAVLLARANEPVPVPTLLEALWGSPAEHGASRLQVHVHRLRRELDDPERLTHEAAGYRLRVEQDELDASMFTALLGEALGEPDPTRAAQTLRRALGFWRGRPYQEVDLPDLAPEVERLTEQRLLAVEELYDAELRAGRHDAVVGELEEAVHRHPLRERLAGLLMLALHRSGRHADAMAEYQRACQVLNDELGLDPGPELRALHDQISGGRAAEPAGRAPAPSQLPRTTGTFIGRDHPLSELDRIVDEITDAVPITVISGTAGVGKTALALRWARRVERRFPDGRLYTDLRGFGSDSPADPGDVLAGWLRALGVDGKDVPLQVAERAARLRSLLDCKRVLLFLDNAVSAEQVRPLLPGASGCAVVVTSRDQLTGLVVGDGAQRVELDRMGLDEARLLMKELLGDLITDDGAVDELIERCARLPLALRVAAERVRRQGHHGLGRIVAEFSSARDRLDLLDGDDPQARLRTVFGASYRHLSASEATLFRMLGLHPGREVDACSLTALAGGADVRTTHRGLAALARAHLVEEVAGKRFRLHDLLAGYAAELVDTTETAGQQREALRRLCDYYLQATTHATGFLAPGALPPRAQRFEVPPMRDHEDAARWLEGERELLVRLADTAEGAFDHYAVGFAAALDVALDFGWHVDEAVRVHGKARVVAARTGDRDGEVMALRGLGVAHLRRTEFGKAHRLLDRALELARGPARTAGVLLGMGELCMATGRAETALEHLHRSTRLYQEAGLPLLALRPMVCLGRLHRRRRRHRASMECLLEASRVAAEHRHPPAEAGAACALAALYRDLGRYEEAAEQAERALVLARRTRLRSLEGVALHRLGSIRRCQGDHARAWQAHLAALTFARQVRSATLEAMTLTAMAETHGAMGDAEKATRCHLHALGVAGSGSGHYARARAHTGLGDLHEAAGRHDTATRHWGTAARLYENVGAPEAADLRRRLDEEITRSLPC